jgi:hypothetical protein
MLLQRIAGLDKVHNPIGQTDQRRQFNGAVQLDDFDLHTAFIKIPIFGYLVATRTFEDSRSRETCPFSAATAILHAPNPKSNGS